jgi:hypothetical protein
MGAVDAASLRARSTLGIRGRLIFVSLHSPTASLLIFKL